MILRKLLLFPMLLIALSCGSSGYPVSDATTSVYCQTEPAIISRQEWDARTPQEEMESLEPVRFIIHHSGVSQTPAVWIGDRMASIQDYHMDELGSPDILYHYYIGPFGNIAEGRELQFDINRETYDSSGAIHIALEGNFETDIMTSEQLESLDHLLCFLSDGNAINPQDTFGHKDLFSETLCPGSELYMELGNIITRVEDLL